MKAAYQPDMAFLQFLQTTFKLPKGRPFQFKPFMLPLYAFPLREKRFLAI
jgi:hypothetical protein